MKQLIILSLAVTTIFSCSKDGRIDGDFESNRMSASFSPTTTVIEVYDSLATEEPLPCFYANNHVKLDASVLNAEKYRWHRKDSNGVNNFLNNDSIITISREGQYQLTYEKTHENIGVIESRILLDLDFCETWVEIPRSFTPDGDGQFETWFPFFEGVSDFYVAVSNESNQTIFTSDNEEKVFNGQHNNTKLPNGTYHFYISGTFHNGWLFERKGSFELVR